VLYCKTPFTQISDERLEFKGVFPDIVQDCLKLPKELRPLLSEHITKCIEYNVPEGKQNRGISVVASYRLLASPDQLTQENIRLACVLGWTVEFLQAFFLVADDMMDASEMRRGKPCWYKQPHVGLSAINDGILLEACIHSILRTHFRDKSYYMDLVELMLEIIRKTSWGQSLDMMTAETFKQKQGSSDCLDHFTMDRYKAIVKYKTSYYSFYLPVALAMRMAGVTDEKCYSMAERILLDMGLFFQIQDDYLDCYGDPKETGKLGTDIQDAKCSWLIAVALQRAHGNKSDIAARYGSVKPEDVDWVKQFYNKQGLKKVYAKFEEESYGDLQESIQQLGTHNIPQQVFHNYLSRLYKREK